MSLRIRFPRRRIALTTVLGLVASHLALCTAVVQAAPPASQPDTATPDLKPIQAQVAQIRALKFKRNVPAQKQDLKDFEQFIDHELAKIFPPGKAEDICDGLMQLGLLREKIDLGGSLKQALLTQAGAYYDPGSGKFFYLMTSLPKAQLEAVASHELVHALQDQYFDLRDLQRKEENDWWTPVRNDDRILAATFLIEGEATYVQMVWQMKYSNPIGVGMDLMKDPNQEEMIFRMSANMSAAAMAAAAKTMKAFIGDEAQDILNAIDAMDKIPPYIMEPLFKAYTGGAYFTMKLRHHGGWDGVANAHKNLPLSTEQVLHPEKYLDKRDDPTPIKMHDLKAMTAHGFKRIDTAIHGEFYLSVLLGMHGLTDNVARKDCEGWDGDLYQAYRGANGQVCVVMVTTWDDARSAQGFADAYLSILPAKLGLDQVTRLSESANSTDVTYLCDPDGAVGRVTVRGREVFLVEGAHRDVADAAIDEMLNLKIEHVE